MNGLHVTIGAAPHRPPAGQSISLHNEIRLLKPALLYGDHVSLYSPVANLLSVMGGAREISDEEKIRLLRLVGPILDPQGWPAVSAQLEVIWKLRKKPRRTGKEIGAVLHFNKVLKTAWSDVAEKITEILQDAAADELTPAIETGLLTIEPIGQGNPFDAEEIVPSFMGKLASILADGSVYPLFDLKTGELIRLGVAAGLFAPNASSARGKQVSAASEFLNRLPAFPKASMQEILDIRTELRQPLGRFRAAMIEMGRTIAAAPYGEEFSQEVEDVYLEKVVPALQEIDETVRANSYLRTLLGEVILDARTVAADIIALATAHFVDLPVLIVGGVAISSHLAQAAWKQAQGSREIRQHQLYLLYRTNELLNA